MDPYQKFPFVSSSIEKKRAVLSPFIMLVNVFPSYLKTPSNEAVQMFPLRSCMTFRVMIFGGVDATLIAGGVLGALDFVCCGSPQPIHTTISPITSIVN